MKTEGLGKTQLALLRCLIEHSRHEWHRGCGWTWNGVGMTERLCITLERRGILERSEFDHLVHGRVPRWSITNLALVRKVLQDARMLVRR